MVSFKGKITTTGKSEAIRLDKSFFRLYPEFHQKAVVLAHVVGPGKILISLEDDPSSIREDELDPLLATFLDFLEKDMTAFPSHITELTEETMQRLNKVTKDVVVCDDEDIPDDITL